MPTEYTAATQAAYDAAAAISRHVHTEDLAGGMWGVAISRPDAPGWIAILATTEDDPAAGWGVYTGPAEREMDGRGWSNIPNHWGDTPAAIGAAFARAYGRARR